MKIAIPFLRGCSPEKKENVEHPSVEPLSTDENNTVFEQKIHASKYGKYRDLIKSTFNVNLNYTDAMTQADIDRVDCNVETFLSVKSAQNLNIIRQSIYHLSKDISSIERHTYSINRWLNFFGVLAIVSIIIGIIIGLSSC